jgi:hypothetical protein
VVRYLWPSRRRFAALVKEKLYRVSQNYDYTFVLISTKHLQVAVDHWCGLHIALIERTVIFGYGGMAKERMHTRKFLDISELQVQNTDSGIIYSPPNVCPGFKW